MRADDLVPAERLSAEAFRDLEERLSPRHWPEPTLRSPERARQWLVRTATFLVSDPEGCWVTEIDGEMVGFATSFRRDLTWFLATYAVRPGRQGAGIGQALLDAALTHSQGCLRGMLAASSDPGAARRYVLAGFTLHPQMFLRGVVDRDSLPVVEHVRDGTAGDFDLMDSVDRRIRDAAHGRDHELLNELYRLIVIDTTTGSGYAYLNAAGEPSVLAATNRRTASRLLWEALACSAPGSEVTVSHITGANQWAIDVGVAARLAVGTNGYLALRDMKPPTPYIHHGSLL